MAVDDNMAYAACVLISSLKETSEGPFEIVMGFHRGTLSPTNQGLIQEICHSLDIPCELRVLEVDSRFITQGHISATTFSKFQLADLYPECHLWIDADTVALRGWDALFDLTASAPHQAGLVVAERGDVGSPEGKSVDNPSLLPFNAGILGWPESSRRDWTTALDELDVVATQEQYLLNSLYAETAMRVSEKFNMMTYRLDSVAGNDAPFIIHFAGAHKPWQLHPRFRQACRRHGCPWSEWFKAEEFLLQRTELAALTRTLHAGAISALKTDSVSAGRHNSGLRLVKMLNILGPLGWLLIHTAKFFQRHIPRGTHPLH